MPLSKETRSYQSKLARYCRTDTYESIPGVRDDRVGTYRRLVFNVVTGALENAYPVTHHMLSNEEWDTLVQDFFENHNAVSPQLWKFPKELYEFVLSESYAEKLSRPYLNDLLLFEWVEIEVFMMPDVQSPLVLKDGDVLSGELVLNPEFHFLKLNYPVFNKVEGDLADQAGEYYLHVYRHPETKSACFSQLSALAVTFVELLRGDLLSGSDLIEIAAEFFNVPLNDEFRMQGQALLERLIQDRIVLGLLEESNA